MVLKITEEKSIFKSEEEIDTQIGMLNTAEVYDADAEDEWDEDYMGEVEEDDLVDEDNVGEGEDSEWVDEDSDVEEEEKGVSENAECPEERLKDNFGEKEEEEEKDEEDLNDEKKENVGSSTQTTREEDVEEEAKQIEIIDYLLWRRENVEDEDPDYIFYINFDGIFSFVQLLRSGFPDWHLISVKSTQVSPIPLPSDILNRNFDDDSDFDDSIANETEITSVDDDFNVSFQSSSSLFDDTEVPIPIDPPSQSKRLIVQLTMDNKMNPQMMKKHLTELDLEFKSAESWIRDPGDKPSTFMVSFKESYDFVLFLQEDISFPLDSIVSCESTPESPISLPEDILNSQVWRKIKSTFQTSHLDRLKLGFTTPHCDLRVKLVMDAKIIPEKMEKTLKKSRFVASYRLIRTLSNFII